MRLKSNTNDSTMGLPDLIKNEKDWIKKAVLISSYHKMKLEEKGNKRGEKWRLTDTARELDFSIGYVSETLKIVDFIERSESNINWYQMSRDMILEIMRQSKL